MKYFLGGIILTLSMGREPLFDFNENSELQDWKIMDDGVMGGKSSGTFLLSREGHGVFEGTISLENNGGFSSVRYPFKKIKVTPDTKIRLRLKGDGKNYQLRIKDAVGTYYSYVAYFTTSGAWEDIEIPLKTMYPSFRGRKLDLPNFSQDTLEEIAFLIGNKRSEKFKLLIDTITLE
ncbi:MAG: CIA30 family protein [Maribacter sp.]|nr:CIA30 family protein [Maribacter sp.]